VGENKMITKHHCASILILLATMMCGCSAFESGVSEDKDLVCETDEDCVGKARCLDEKCTTYECVTDDHCDAGFICKDYFCEEELPTDQTDAGDDLVSDADAEVKEEPVTPSLSETDENGQDNGSGNSDGNVDESKIYVSTPSAPSDENTSNGAGAAVPGQDNSSGPTGDGSGFANPDEGTGSGTTGDGSGFAQDDNDNGAGGAGGSGGSTAQSGTGGAGGNGGTGGGQAGGGGSAGAAGAGSTWDVPRNCPSDLMCNVLSGTPLCVEPDTYASPTCEKQADCEVGACLEVSDVGQKYCFQVCKNPNIEVWGYVSEYSLERLMNFEALLPLNNVEVCLFENDTVPCASSDADGYYRFSHLPNETSYLITLSKSGFAPSLKPALPYMSVMTTSLIPQSQLQSFASQAGQSLSNSKAVVIFAGVKTGPGDNVAALEGFRVGTDPASGGVPAYINYNESQGIFMDPALSASSVLGFGAIFNMAPGEYELTITHPDSSLDCSTRIPVVTRAGYVSSDILLYCTAE